LLTDYGFFLRNEKERFGNVLVSSSPSHPH